MDTSTPLLPAARRLVPLRVQTSSRRTFARLLPHSDMTLGLLCLILDAVLWLGCYGVLLFLYERLKEDVGGLAVSVFVAQFLIIVACLFIVGGYDRRTRFMSLNYMSEHCITLAAAGCLGGLVIYAGSTFDQQIHPSRGVLLVSQLAFVPLSLLSRRSIGRMLEAQGRHQYFLVLGAGELARHLYRSNLVSTHRQALRFVDPNLFRQTESRGPVEAESTDGPVIEKLNVERFTALLGGSNGVVIATEATQMSAELIDWLTRLHYEEAPVYTLETFYERYWRRVPTYAIAPTWPLQMGAHLTSESPYSHAKRLFDLGAAGLGLLVLSPLLLLLSLLVALESGRPVLFRQQRVGRDRRPFSLCKFRSMYVRPPGQEGSLYTGEKDARITKVGAWLRKLRLDELPQLWNVLRGDMSLIGPRAEWDQLVDRYEQVIPFYHFRHLVKPGITGWAQVNYPYGANVQDAEQKLKYDLYYIRHYSLRLDAMIVFKTLHIMLWGKGQ